MSDSDLVVCANCKALKPTSAYYTLKTRGNRLSSVCKDCRKKESKLQKKEHVEAPDFIRCLLCEEVKPSKEYNLRRDRRTNRPVCLTCFRNYAATYGVDVDKNKKYRLPDILIINGHKQCNGCNQNLPISEFAKNLAAPHGLDWKCKECQRIKREAYLGKRHAENPNVYWQTRLSNRHIYGDLSIAFVRNLYESHKFCEYCLIPFTDPREAHFEHRIPRAKGGPTTPENVTFACDQCNRAKNDMSETEFRAWLSALVKRMHIQTEEPKEKQLSGQDVEMLSYGLESAVA